MRQATPSSSAAAAAYRPSPRRSPGSAGNATRSGEAKESSSPSTRTRGCYATGCGWPVAFSVDVDSAWSSGFYEVGLHGDGETGEAASSEAFFVVRPAAGSTADAILVLATNTYNAYNQWGGKCLYSDGVKMSFDRPIERGYLRRPAAPDEIDYDGRVLGILDELDEEHHQLQEYLADFEYPLWCASSGWHNWERRFVRWAESGGFDARLCGQLRSRVPSRGARWATADAQRRPRRVLVGEDARSCRCIRRGRWLVGDLLGQHLLLAGSIRGRRSDDGLLQGQRRRRTIPCVAPTSTPRSLRCGRCRPSAAPRR